MRWSEWESKTRPSFSCATARPPGTSKGAGKGTRIRPSLSWGESRPRQIASRLSGLKVAAIYSSDLGRAKEMAEVIAAPHKLSVIAREDLRERNYGMLEGKTVGEAAVTEGGWFRAWQADHLRMAPPMGETQQDMAVRVMEALCAIADRHPRQNVIVSTHGGPIKSAICHILSIPLTLWRYTWISNGSITTLRGNRDVMRVASFNDTCHLDAGPGPDTMEG